MPEFRYINTTAAIWAQRLRSVQAISLCSGRSVLCFKSVLRSVCAIDRVSLKFECKTSLCGDRDDDRLASDLRLRWCSAHTTRAEQSTRYAGWQKIYVFLVVQQLSSLRFSSLPLNLHLSHSITNFTLNLFIPPLHSPSQLSLRHSHSLLKPAQHGSSTAHFITHEKKESNSFGHEFYTPSLIHLHIPQRFPNGNL